MVSIVNRLMQDSPHTQMFIHAVCMCCEFLIISDTRFWNRSLNTKIFSLRVGRTVTGVFIWLTYQNPFLISSFICRPTKRCVCIYIVESESGQVNDTFWSLPETKHMYQHMFRNIVFNNIYINIWV